MAKHWYVVHTYSGYEQKAKKALEDRIAHAKAAHLFDEILVPTEEVVEMKKGVKKTTKRQFFPGYILVRMELTDDAWYIVKGTPKITGFVGSSKQPPIVPDAEVERLTSQIQEGSLKPKPKIEFEKGENIRVASGPFANFTGVVDNVSADKNKLRVLVSIFGRSTPIEIGFEEVEKVNA